jgi:membrane protein required for colicin V production
MALTWIDYFIIVVIAGSAIIGVFRGLVNEVLSLVVWVIALWVAFQFSIQLSSVFISYIAQPSLRYGISFVILLLVTLIIGGLIRWLFNKLVESTGLGGINRSIGLVFGLIRGILLVAILILIAEFTKLPTLHAWIHSVLLPHFHPLVSWLQQWLPAGWSPTNITVATGKA